MAIKLITLEDIVAFKPLSINMNVAKGLDPYILEAQEFDIREVLGDPLYLAMLDDAPDFNTEIYDKLFNGCDYVYEGLNYQQSGVKASLIYFTYARYLANANQTPTAFGMVQKKNDYSDPITDKQLAIKIQQAKSGAMAYQNKYVEYLNRFKEDYPLWKTECRNNKIQKISTKIRAISKY